MPVVQCANCGTDLLIDEPNGVAYITHEDGAITCADAVNCVPMEVVAPEEEGDA